MRMRSIGLVAGFTFAACSGPSGAGGSDSAATGDSSGSATVDSSSGAGATSAASTVGSGDADGSTSGVATTAASSEGSTGSGGSPGCSSAEYGPGEHAGLTMEFDGTQRRFDLFIPSAYDADTPLPVVLNFHGYTSNPSQQAFFSEFNGPAEDHSMIVVYPAGTANSWNGGSCCGQAASNDVDDVGFARALVDHVAEILCMDPDRVYAMGMSNGGFMSHRLACEASDVFAAIGPVAGVLGIPPEDCNPSRPVPVLHFHGTNDTLVPYDGGAINVSVAETMSGWASRNGCDAQSEVTFEMADVTCETWPSCDADVEVTLCTIENGGHCWPGNTFCPFGGTTETLHASEEIAEFFEGYSL